MLRYLIGQLGAGILALPWIVGGEIAAVNISVWCHPITVRPIRSFIPRVRTNWIEFGHVESTDPNIDTSR